MDYSINTLQKEGDDKIMNKIRDKS
jgi:hypothetical protein